MPEAEELVGLEIFIPEEILRPLEEGYFYQFELIGCAVFNKAGEKLGSVRELLSIKDNHLLVIERDKDGKEVLVPFSQAICLEVDRLKKKIVIDPPHGLLDLNEI